MHKAVGVEEKHLKDELHLKRVLNDMFPSKANAPTEVILKKINILVTLEINSNWSWNFKYKDYDFYYYFNLGIFHIMQSSV